MTATLPPALSLAGQHVVLSGAAGGIGRATARAAAALGARLSLVDLAAPEEIADELRRAGAEADAHGLDVSDRAAVDALAAALGPVDGLIAGAAICPFGDWQEDPDWDATFRRVLDVNLLGPLNMARAWLEPMAARGGGRMVMVGSIGGRNGGTSPIVQPHYIASKGGLHAFTMWLAQRAGPRGVLVNAVAPGPVETAMSGTTPYDTSVFPLGRKATPEEIAWPIVFLLTPAAGYFSGQVMDVNGGLFVH